MDLASIVGFFGGTAVVVIGIVIGGNALGSYLDIPSVFIVVVGSLFAAMLAVPLKTFMQLPTFLKIAFTERRYNNGALIHQLVSFSELARREGLLSLDDRVNSIEDEFLRTGMRLVVDGTDPDVIKSVLYTNLDKLEARHGVGSGLFVTWATFAPAFGMIGTLLGLIGMLKNLDDTASIGPNMSVALITTLYGSFLANMTLLPIATKLQGKNDTEVSNKEIAMEGVLSIQAGDNPRIMEQKLMMFLSPKDRAAVGSSEEQPAAS